MGENKEKFNDPETRTRVSAIAEKYRLSLVLLFGSQATGKTHKQSDVDIAILSENGLRPRELAELAYELASALHTREIDITDLDSVSPLLLAGIAKSAFSLYEQRQSDFARFRIYAIKRFMEAKTLFQLRDVVIETRLKHV